MYSVNYTSFITFRVKEMRSRTAVWISCIMAVSWRWISTTWGWHEARTELTVE